MSASAVRYDQIRKIQAEEYFARLPAMHRDREDTIVRRLLESEGVKLLVLGGAHGLMDNVELGANRDVELIVVESEAWARFGGQ